MPAGDLAAGQLVILENTKDGSQNDMGLIATDKAGKELGRYILSFWAVGHDDKDVKDVLNAKNRAVVAIDLSNANTWEVSKDTKEIHVSNLNRQGVLNVLEAVQDFGEDYQYFNEYEIKMPDGTMKMPAITSNSLVEFIVDVATSEKAFEDGVAKMSFLQLHVDAKTAKQLEPVSALQVKELMASKTFNSHYNKDLFLVPAVYDAKGKALKTPDQWYVVQTSGVGVRDNSKQASLVQQKAHTRHHRRHRHGRKTLLRSLMQQKSKGHHRHHRRHHGLHHRRHSKK